MLDGERLEEARKDKPMTQQELGVIVGVSNKTISSYEKNKIEPKVANLIKIAKELNVSLDYLCGIIDEEISYGHENYVVLPRDCSPEFKKRVLETIDVLKKANI